MARLDDTMLEQEIVSQIDGLFNQARQRPLSRHDPHNRTSYVASYSQPLDIGALVREPTHFKHSWREICSVPVQVQAEFVPPKGAEHIAGMVGITIAIPEDYFTEGRSIQTTGTTSALARIAQHAGLTNVSDAARLRWEMDDGTPEVMRGEYYIVTDMQGHREPHHFCERHTLYFHTNDKEKLAETIADMAHDIPAKMRHASR